MKRIHTAVRVAQTFSIPLGAGTAILLGLLITYVGHAPTIAVYVYLSAILFGSYGLIKDTIQAIRVGNFALDYIALLAITVGVLSGHYLVATVIVLMLSGGEALEDYSLQKAQSSLARLANRLPHKVYLWQDGALSHPVSIDEVSVGAIIAVRKGEVIPLDGTLLSPPLVLVDESSLTGEAFPVDKKPGELIRSGTVNTTTTLTMQVTKGAADSTYRKIIQMVEAAQAEKAPLIRLADRYSGVFTLVTLVIAVGAYFISGGDLSRALAVLVIATPCPLILATPIALMGGMSAAARQRIIFKRLASIETLSRVNALMFDKTGTITVGRPTVQNIVRLDHTVDPSFADAITLTLEKNSLHPLAKALVENLQKRQLPPLTMTHIHEQVGVGISGSIGGHSYSLGKPTRADGMIVALRRDDVDIVHYHLVDEIKKDSTAIFARLHKQGIHLAIFTGDIQSRADELARQLGVPIHVQAHCAPEDKKQGIEKWRREGKVTAMVGDGINDAPALAYADVGMVFANEENTAATEAADVVILGGDTKQILDAIALSRHTIRIALQSILAGIAISTLGMLFAAAGHVPPLLGAFIQESIDILVIIHALRASRGIAHT